MKKLVILLLFFVYTIASAQTYNTYAGAAENKQKYSPIDKSRFKPLSQEEDTLRFTGVFHGLVAGGVKFAWLENELTVFNKKTKKITRIYDCGNKGEFFLQKENILSEEKYIPLSVLSQLHPGPPGKDGYTPIKGKDYFDGKKGDKGDDGSSIVGYIAIGVAVVGIIVALLIANNRHTTTNNYNTPPIVAPPTGTPPGGQTGLAFSFGL